MIVIAAFIWRFPHSQGTPNAQVSTPRPTVSDHLSEQKHLPIGFGKSAQRTAQNVEDAIARMQNQVANGEVANPQDLVIVSEFITELDLPLMIETCSAFPLWLLKELEPEVLSAIRAELRTFDPTEPQSVLDGTSDYAMAIELLGCFSSPKTGEILLGELDRVSIGYYYQTEAPPFGVQAGLTVPAKIASAIVTNGNPQTMDDYWRIIRTTDNSEMKLMLVWALGDSHRFSDFEQLYGLTVQELGKDESTDKVATRALNRLVTTMTSYALSDAEEEPDQANLPLDKGARRKYIEELLEAADRSIQMLVDADLYLENVH
ncbi:MAG: hypothetical protein R3F19_27415 [Verrucomicrobiales bacterium]